MAEPQFDAPIAGMGMTHELGARPWQRPPLYTTVEEALDYYIPRMADDEFSDQLVDVMDMGVPLTTLANTIQMSGVMDGKHSADVGILIMPVLIEMMAYIAEQANGKASDGFRRIMEIQPTELHERVPFFCGSPKMVEKAEEFMARQKIRENE